MPWIHPSVPWMLRYVSGQRHPHIQTSLNERVNQTWALSALPGVPTTTPWGQGSHTGPVLALGRVCHSRSCFPSTAFGYSHSKWRRFRSCTKPSPWVKNNDNNHEVTPRQVLQQKALHNRGSLAKSRKSPIHSSSTTVRRGETWIWRSSTPPTVLLTSNGKKKQVEGYFLPLDPGKEN